MTNYVYDASRLHGILPGDAGDDFTDVHFDKTLLEPGIYASIGISSRIANHIHLALGGEFSAMKSSDAFAENRKFGRLFLRVQNGE